MDTPKKNKKQQLGKGIRALLSTIDDPQSEVAVSHDEPSSISEIPLSWIEANPFQPRQEFARDALENLAQSIRTHGIVQPLTVRRLSAEAYQLIAGERRLRAAKLAGLESVPAYIRLADDQLLLEMALLENIQREDLNPLEVAFSMNRLIAECDLTHESLSERLGKSRSAVTNFLRLLKLPPEIQKSVRHSEISMGHARALAGISDLPLQLELFHQTVGKQLSVRALENLIKSYTVGKSASAAGRTDDFNPEIRQIRDEISGIFGSKVMVKRNKNGAGSINIHFKNDRGFNELLEVIRSIDE